MFLFYVNYNDLDGFVLFLGVFHRIFRSSRYSVPQNDDLVGNIHHKLVSFQRRGFSVFTVFRSQYQFGYFVFIRVFFGDGISPLRPAAYYKLGLGGICSDMS